MNDVWLAAFKPRAKCLVDHDNKVRICMTKYNLPDVSELLIIARREYSSLNDTLTQRKVCRVQKKKEGVLL